MKTITKHLGIASIATLGILAATSSTVRADKRFICQMTGTWAETNDDWKFEAAYISKDGPDTFTGRYTNPGTAEANVVGNAASGVWSIVLTYTDAGHKGMVKKLIGKGAKDPKTNLLKVEGDYKTFVGTNDIKKDGRFKLIGVCR